MDHAELLADTTYAAWPEHRQEAHRALCLAAYHYARVAYEPGPIMDVICAEVLGDRMDGGHDIGVRARESLARAVLRLPLPDLDAPARVGFIPPAWIDRAARAGDERRVADAMRGLRSTDGSIARTPWPECAPIRPVDLGEVTPG